MSGSAFMWIFRLFLGQCGLLCVSALAGQWRMAVTLYRGSAVLATDKLSSLLSPAASVSLNFSILFYKSECLPTLPFHKFECLLYSPIIECLLFSSKSFNVSAFLLKIWMSPHSSISLNVSSSLRKVWMSPLLFYKSECLFYSSFPSSCHFYFSISMNVFFTLLLHSSEYILYSSTTLNVFLTIP